MYHTVFTVMSVRNGFLWLLFDDFGCSQKRLLKILTRCSLTGHTNIQAIQVLNENSRKNLFHNFSKVKFVNCMDFFQNFLNILFVFKASKKHTSYEGRRMFQTIRFIFLLKSSLKQWWEDLQCLITSLRIEMIGIDVCTWSKEIIEKSKKVL